MRKYFARQAVHSRYRHVFEEMTRERSLNSDPLELVIRAEDRGMVWRALYTLPSRQRYIVYSHVLQGLSFTRIGKRVGLNRNMVRREYEGGLLTMRKRYLKLSSWEVAA